MTIGDIDSFSQLSAGHRLKLRKLLKSLKSTVSQDPSSSQSVNDSSQQVNCSSQSSIDSSSASSRSLPIDACYAASSQSFHFDSTYASTFQSFQHDSNSVLSQSFQHQYMIHRSEVLSNNVFQHDFVLNVCFFPKGLQYVFITAD